MLCPKHIAHSTLAILRELCEADAGFPLVKYEIKTAEGTTEHVWGEFGYLNEESFRATLETPFDDWLVLMPDGTVRGAFTLQVELEFAKREGLKVRPHIAALDGRFLDR
jgi:hypothetical protein